MEIESEIFFPAFLDATENSLDVGHENILSQISEAAQALHARQQFNYCVRFLTRLVLSHIRHMEKAADLFDEAHESGMDHDLIGRLLIARKQAEPIAPLPKVDVEAAATSTSTIRASRYALHDSKFMTIESAGNASV